MVGKKLKWETIVLPGACHSFKQVEPQKASMRVVAYSIGGI